MDCCLDALQLCQAVADDNALVSMAVVSVGFAVCDRLDRHRHRRYSQERIPDAGKAIDSAGQLMRRAFGKVLSIGLRYVKTVRDVKTEALLDFARIVVNVLDGMRR